MYIILILSVSVLLWGRVWLGSRGMAFSQLNLASVTIYRDFLMMTMLGLAYYVNDSNYLQHDILGQISSVSPIYEAAFSATYFMLVFVTLFRVFGQIYISALSTWRFPVSQNRYGFLLKLWTLILLILLVYLSSTNTVGVSVLFSGADAEKFGEMRNYLSNSDGSGFSKVVLKGWVPMVSYAWFYHVLVTPGRSSLSDRFFLTISVIMGVIAGVWYFEKSSLVFYIAGFLGVWLFSGRKIPARILFGYLLIGLLLVLGMYFLTYRDKVDGWSYLSDIFIHRFTTQSVGVAMAFEWYPSRLAMKGFSGVSSILANLSGEQFSSVYGDIIDEAVPQFADISGAMSSFAVGDAYGLFGWLGVLISPVILAAYYASVEYSRYVGGLSLLMAPIYGYFFSSFFVASSFYSFIWPIGFVYSFFPLMLIFVLALRRH